MDYSQTPAVRFTAPPGHAVLLVGWDNAKSAWLCKNSWGQSAGPNKDGTFWIAFNGHLNNLNIIVANNVLKGSGCWYSHTYQPKGIFRDARPYAIGVTTFEMMPNVIACTSGDPRGLGYYINANGEIFKATRTSGYAKISNILGKDISHGYYAATGLLTCYLVDRNNAIYKLNSTETGFDLLDGSATAVDVDYTGDAYVIGTDSKLYKRVNSAWVNIPFISGRLLKDVAVHDGCIYVVTTDGWPYYQNPNSTTWNSFPRIGSLASIDVDPDCIYELESSGRISWWKNPGTLMSYQDDSYCCVGSASYK